MAQASALRETAGPATPAGADARGLSVAFYMHDLSGGGVEAMKLTLAAGLRPHAGSVTLVLNRRSGALAGRIPEGVASVELSGRRTAADLVPLVRFLRRSRPDVLVSSLHHNNLLALLAKRLAGSDARLIVCQHNALSAERRQGGSYRAVPPLYRLLSPLADGIVAVSSGVADDLAATTGIRRGRITVIPNPVIDPAFAARCAEPVSHPWLEDPSVPVFVFVGRLVAQKDPLTLLSAFALRASRGPARLLVLGDGPMRARLADLVAALGLGEQVGFLGYVANPLPYVRRAAALVLSSRHEGLGNVIVEALGCGTPVVSTDCPHGPAETLAGGRYGALVPVGDPAALATALDGDLRRRWPAELLRRRAGDYSSEAAVSAYLALFRDLAPTACAAA